MSVQTNGVVVDIGCHRADFTTSASFGFADAVYLVNWMEEVSGYHLGAEARFAAETALLNVGEHIHAMMLGELAQVWAKVPELQDFAYRVRSAILPNQANGMET